MGKNAQARLTDTLNYIKRIADIPANEFSILNAAKGNDTAASQRISLGGGPRGFKPNAGETNRRHALRGLLLCMDWYGAHTKIALAKTHFARVNELTIQTAIKSFFTVKKANALSVIEMAKKIKPNSGQRIGMDNFFKCDREAIKTKRVNLGLACYESVALWIYLSGLTSLRWLKDNGAQPGGKLPSSWNWGEKITSLDDASRIPAGHIVRFLRGEAGLHYTLSIGNGKCIGNHNSVDVCVEWLVDYGTAPGPHTSEFLIAGYLATMQDQYTKATGKVDVDSIPSLRSAPITPKATF